MTGKLPLHLLCPWRKHSVVAHWELETLMDHCLFGEDICYMLDSRELNVNISL